MATVQAVTTRNGGAFKVGNDWLRLSYADARAKGFSMPAKGDEIEYTLNARGYVDSLTMAPKGGSVGTTSSPSPAAQLSTSFLASQMQAAGWAPDPRIRATALVAAAHLMHGVDGTMQEINDMVLAYARGFEVYLIGANSQTSPKRFPTAGGMELAVDTEAVYGKQEPPLF